MGWNHFPIKAGSSITAEHFNELIDAAVERGLLGPNECPRLAGNEVNEPAGRAVFIKIRDAIGQSISVVDSAPNKDTKNVHHDTTPAHHHHNNNNRKSPHRWCQWSHDETTNEARLKYYVSRKAKLPSSCFPPHAIDIGQDIRKSSDSAHRGRDKTDLDYFELPDNTTPLTDTLLNETALILDALRHLACGHGTLAQNVNQYIGQETDLTEFCIERDANGGIVFYDTIEKTIAGLMANGKWGTAGVGVSGICDHAIYLGPRPGSLFFAEIARHTVGYSWPSPQKAKPIPFQVKAAYVPVTVTGNTVNWSGSHWNHIPLLQAVDVHFRISPTGEPWPTHMAQARQWGLVADQFTLNEGDGGAPGCEGRHPFRSMPRSVKIPISGNMASNEIRTIAYVERQPMVTKLDEMRLHQYVNLPLTNLDEESFHHSQYVFEGDFQKVGLREKMGMPA